MDECWYKNLKPSDPWYYIFLEMTTTRLVEDISVEGLTIDGTTVEAMKITRPVEDNNNRKQDV